MSREEVEHRLGEPYGRRTSIRRSGRDHFVRYDRYQYTDGTVDQTIDFVDDKITRINRADPQSLDDDSTVFATIFQFYYLRLAIFFGCVGIFTNLIRGEMVDKSLHFYLLTPMRREVLLAGKFLAGLIATVVIFSAGTALQLAALLWRFRGAEASTYLHHHGWHDIAAYLGVTALACAGYGSVFLACGLLYRNPIIPAAIVLIWESANVFVPLALKKISVIYYLQALCPVVAEPESDLSAPLRLLLSITDPPGTGVAMGGIATFIVIILALAAIRARKLEINYSAE
jgi:ABC-type transport system involved in multi-copper enzyme maturation permease subunit